MAIVHEDATTEEARRFQLEACIFIYVVMDYRGCREKRLLHGSLGLRFEHFGDFLSNTAEGLRMLSDFCRLGDFLFD